MQRIVDAAMRRDKRPDLDARRSKSNRNNAWTSVPTLDPPSGCRVCKIASGEVRALASALGKREGGGSCESSEFLSREMSWIEGIVGDDGGLVLVWRLGV